MSDSAFLDIALGIGLLNPGFLMLVNGVWFSLSVCLLFVFARYVWINRSRGYSELQAAISISIYFTGVSLSHGWVWWWRHHNNAGISAEWMNDWPVLPLGVLLAAFGLLCMIRVFTPLEWGNWGWIGSALATGLLLILFA